MKSNHALMSIANSARVAIKHIFYIIVKVLLTGATLRNLPDRMYPEP